MRRALLLLGVALAVGGQAPDADRRSGFDFMAPETQALQQDDSSNPGMLWVLEGEALWQDPVGAAGASCAGCHGDAAESMRGVAARYPAFDTATGQPIDLQARVNQCRQARQGAEPFAAESQELLALTTLVAHQSRGIPVEPVADPRLTSFVEQGRGLFERRIGQLDLSCAACHDQRWGQKLGGSAIPQAHPTGYPIYRLEWQSVGSLQRRMRNCMIGVRAEPYAFGAPEFTALELYLRARAEGLPVETPGVRP
ncbi:sulfur oxidation c-type cytochrome SoxA [Inquilinus sp.]|jgi:sulfur-oxidizing protein SoxA|uniref:sulfur oxidation c-type cytochrome SoxA n=1 Tax=Inquilinus sp. TaxID=1932117 RepID=UPI0037846ABB